MDFLEKLQRKLANRADAYWQAMRSNLNLVARSPKLTEDYYDRLHAELIDILDQGILIYPQTLHQVGIEEDMSYRDKRKVLGFNPDSFRNADETRFLIDAAFKAQSCRKSNWAWRIGEEAQAMHDAKWHPYFCTLTVDPAKTTGKPVKVGEKELPIYDSPEHLWRDGKEFRKYIRRIVNECCEQLGHPPAHKRVVKKGKVIWDYRPESDYVRYVGVIEHGKSREHHHGHFLIWVRAVPPSWRICPNINVGIPRNRTNNECYAMRTLWPWAAPERKPHLYFRTVGDIWEKDYNFVLPVDKNGQPMKVSTPKVAGLYLMKYLSKEFKQWNHRVKATRNLGLTRLTTVLRSLKTEYLEALMWRSKDSNSNHLLMQIHSVPQGLLRQLAKREHFFQKFRLNQLDSQMLLQSNSDVFMRMLQSVRAGVRPDRMNSLEYFDWVAALLPVPSGYSEKLQFEAHTALQKHFPPFKVKVNATKIGGNKLGHT